MSFSPYNPAAKDKLYTTNGLNQYTSICTDDGIDDGAANCVAGTSQAISYDAYGNIGDGQEGCY